MELTIEQALQQGVAAHKKGKLQDAERLYRAVLQSQPLHPDVNHNLGVLAVSVNKADAALPLFKIALEANPKIEQFWLSYIDALIKEKQFDNAKAVLEQAEKQGLDNEKLNSLKVQIVPISQTEYSDSASPSQQQLNSLLGYYQTGRLSDAEKLALSFTQEFPKHQFGWKVLSAVLLQTGRTVEAENANRTSVALSPQDAEAHSNLGITLNELGRLDEAEASYTQAIALKPDYAEAHYNFGITLNELGRLDEAEASYKQAIALKPDFVEACNNLVALLTTYTSQKKSSQPIVKVDQEIKEVSLKDKTSGVISNEKIIYLFYKSSKIIKNHDLDLGTHLSQVYRRNSIDLNCKRHKSIFNKFNVIPNFCFGCYKVQVEPGSVLELIKLLVVFDQIKLPENNSRKCMIEMRSEISGFYKGLIYCSSLEEAYQIADILEMVVKDKIGLGIPLTVKRGCSEYSIAFPDYKEINKSGAQLMNYNDDWELIEEDYDLKNSIQSKRIKSPSLSSLTLSDVLIIRNWIDYAKGIGDSSAHLLNQNTVVSQNVYEIAKTRLKTHFWRESVPCFPATTQPASHPRGTPR